VTDVGAAYAEGRRRLTELVADLDEEGAATPVPTCPQWSVHDVVAHLAGVCADVLAGRIDGVGTDPWTDAQVAARRATPLKDVVAEWNEVAPAVEAMAGDFGAAGYQWVGDQAIHEHDVRGALDRAGARDSETIGVGLRFMVPGFLQAVASRGLPVLELRAGDRTWTSGDEGDAPAEHLALAPFEALRAICGRRSPDQLRALPWTGDPERYLPAFTWGPFQPPAAAVVE
jgi:uncharacterized protein (TIGR03083 family)